MQRNGVKIIPRTGIEQPYMMTPPKFNEISREFERIATINVSI